jgi:anti-sigma factor ChrR (cupin superfamily)
VLEGGYRDDGGRAFEAGDLDEHEGGTSHAFEALPDEPCVTVTVLERGIDFESWPLRGLMRLLGR